MSEYQYYEFLALDKPLTDEQRAELRKLSSRAEITATRFVNEYNYGDFRGSPEKLMERYFDAFLYLANWGTRRYVPLPACSPRRRSRAAVPPHGCRLGDRDQRTTYHQPVPGPRPDNYWAEADDRLAPMVQARSDLAAGDLRLLYLGWLLGAQWADQDEETP